MFDFDDEHKSPKKPKKESQKQILPEDFEPVENEVLFSMFLQLVR